MIYKLITPIITLTTEFLKQLAVIFQKKFENQK